MDESTAQRLLQSMIDYFGGGNKESDRIAKEIIGWDFDNQELWQREIRRLRESGEWTGLRAPEADIIVDALRYIQHMLSTADGKEV